MKASELDLRALLQFDPSGGVIRFANDRVLLLDAVAMGLLRKQLIETLGLTAARAVLTRFGYAHGWRTAEALEQACRGTATRSGSRPAGGSTRCRDWSGSSRPTWDPAHGPKPIAFAVWQDSYEAEQHLLHLGRADEAVCWTLTGFASGYLSRAHGREIYCIEDRCRGKGDAVCRLVGRPLEEWGDAFADHLPFYGKACMEASLTQLTDELKRVERTLRARRHALGPPPRRARSVPPASSRRAPGWSGCSTWRVASPRWTPRC